MKITTRKRTQLGIVVVTTEADVKTKGKDTFKENRRASIQRLCENQTNWIDTKDQRKAERKAKRRNKKDVYSY